MSVNAVELFEAVNEQIGKIADSLGTTSNTTWDNGETQSVGGMAWIKEGNSFSLIPFCVTLPCCEEAEEV